MIIEDIVNQIWQGDSLKFVARLPENSIDMVFADPPYNLQLHQELRRPDMSLVDPVDDDWDQFAQNGEDQFTSFEAYDAFTRAWLTLVRRVMKETGSIWISGTYHNIFRVGTILQDLGFWILNTVTWYKHNAMPNFNGTRLRNDVEFIIWAKYTRASRYTFHHHLMKQFNDFSTGKQLGSVWRIPACTGPERIKASDGKKLHSTQKPEALLHRILLASSKPDDLILDPFSGTGTTAAVAKKLHRRWIAIEQNPVYVAASKERLVAVDTLGRTHPLITATATEKPPRVPFKRLVKQAYLRPGQHLYLDKPEIRATILENGHIRTKDHTGSIHKLACLLKGKPSCNGWKHWFFEDDEGERRPIDDLRQQYRAEDRQPAS